VKQALLAIGQRADAPAFHARLTDAVGAYGITRAAASEITTGLISLGGVLYGLFPAAPAIGLVIAATGGLMLASTLFATFAGAVSDPIQRGHRPARTSPQAHGRCTRTPVY
jgi:hypothetical protein